MIVIRSSEFDKPKKMPPSKKFSESSLVRTQNGDQNRIYPCLILQTAKYFPSKRVLKKGQARIKICPKMCCSNVDDCMKEFRREFFLEFEELQN